MIRFVEIAVAGTLAAGAHLAAFSAWQNTPGTEATAAGQAGQSEVTLRAAPAQLSALIADWDTPPDVAQPSTPPDLQLTALDLPAPSNSAMPRVPTQAIQRPDTPPPPPRDLPQVAAPTHPAPAVPNLPRLTAPRLDRTPVLSRPNTPHQSAAPLPPLQPAPQSPPPAALDTTPPTPLAQTAPVRSARPKQRSARMLAARPEPASKPQSKPATSKPPRTTSKPATQKPQAPAVSANTRAAGSGGAPKTRTGSVPKPSAAAPSKGQLRKLEAAWGAAILGKIQRNASSSRAGPATVRLSVDVARSGKVLRLRVAKSSGQKAFDDAAVRAVKRARRFKAAPKGLSDSFYTFVVPVRFR